MEISQSLHSWLQEFFAFQDPQSADKFQVPADLLQYLVDGPGVLAILHYLFNKRLTATSSLPDEQQLELGSSPTDRLHNWNLLAGPIETLGLGLTNDSKSLIVAGDLGTLLDLLERLRGAEAEEPAGQGVVIERLDSEKTLSESCNCLEFLVLSFCQHFKLSPKHSSTLLANGNRYLALILVKGLKSNYGPVISWLEDLCEHAEKIRSLLEQEPEALGFVLDALKPGFISKDVAVIEFTMRTLAKLLQELRGSELLDQAITWFTDEEHSALGLTIVSLQQYGQALHQCTASLYTEAGQIDCIGFWGSRLRSLVDSGEAYLQLIADLIPHIPQEIIHIEVIGYWLEAGIRAADTSGPRIAAMHFISTLLTTFHRQLNSATINSVLGLLNKVCRDQSMVVRFEAISLLFYLLEFLANQMSAFTSVVYRALTFLFLQSYDTALDREFIEANFSSLFKTIPGIPIGVLVEPLIKRLKLQDQDFDIQGLSFFMHVSRLKTLSDSHAVMLADVFGRIYLNDIVFSRVAGVIFTELVYRHIESAHMQEFLLKFFKYSISLAVQTEEFNHQYKRKVIGISLRETRMIQELRQQRNLILNMAAWVLQQWIEPLNSKLKSLLIDHYQRYRETLGERCGPLYEVLSLIGVPETPPRVEPEPVHTPIPEEIAAPQRKPEVVKPSVEVERARERYRQKRMQEKLEAERKVKEFQAQQKRVQKQLELRRLEQQKTRTAIKAKLLESGIVRKVLSLDEVELRELESDEKDHLRLFFKKYSRVFLVWFQKYSGTGFERKQIFPSDFDYLATRKQRINEAEILKLMTDHGVVPKLITKEELKMVMGKFCLHILKQAELRYVDYPGFKELFSQIALYMYSKQPNDFSHLPALYSVERLLGFMREHLRSKNLSTDLFDEPDPGTGDRDIVRKLNALLVENPEIPIPEGYTRIQYLDPVLVYRVPVFLGVSESYRLAYETLDSILGEALGFHVLVPQVSINKGFRAKGSKPKIDVKELPPIYQRPLKREREPRQRKNQSSRHLKVSPELKFLLAHTTSDREVNQECALLLEDLLTSVQLKMTRLKNKPHKIDTDDQEQIEISKRKEQEKLARRQQMLLESLAKAKQERQETLRRQAEIRDREQMENQARQALLNQRALKAQEVKRKKLEDYHTRKALQKEQETRKQSEKEFKDRELRKKSLESVKRKNVETIKSLLRGKSSRKTKSLEKNHSKTRTESLDREKQIRQVIKYPSTQELFREYYDRLSGIHQSYSKGQPRLVFDKFHKLLVQFGVNNFVREDEIREVYAISRSQLGQSEQGLSFADFEMALIRLAARGRLKLDEVGREFSTETIRILLDYLDIEKMPKRLKEKMGNLSAEERRDRWDMNGRRRKSVTIKKLQDFLD